MRSPFATDLMAVLMAEDLLELPIAKILIKLLTLAFTLSSSQWGALPNPTQGEAFCHAIETLLSVPSPTNT